jgi:tripartite-type tricarboxylate transporter receptor subunit TctC
MVFASALFLPCPAKAGHPVIAALEPGSSALVTAGSSAFADDDKERANNDKAGPDDDNGRGCWRTVALAVLSALFACVLAPSSPAQTPAEFYKGKTIDLYIGSSVGGGYDLYGRMLARHIGRYIPGNPSVVPKNMEGAGGLRLANFLYNAAARDGTALATIYRGNAFDPLLGGKGGQFDATKFNWVGSTNHEVSVCVAWHTSGIARYEDVLAHDLIVGASGPSADTYQFPKIANGVLGTRFKIVTGYPGGNEIDLAMERGEVGGRCGWSWTSLTSTRRAWIEQKRMSVLFQMALTKHAELPNVPLIIDLAKTDEGKAILKLIFGRQVMAWPYVAPSGVPAERVAALRKAFMATMQDREFLADAEKAKLEINPVSGEDIEKLVQDVYRTPADLVHKVAGMLK